MTEPHHGSSSASPDEEPTVLVDRADGPAVPAEPVVPTRVTPDDPHYEPAAAKTMYQRFVIDEDDDAEPSVPQRALTEPGEPVEDAPTAAVAEPAPAQKVSVGRASAVMAAGSLVSRILGMVRTFMLAAIVATYGAADAFQVANTMPNILFNLLNAGVLNAVLIPQITAAMKRPDGGKDYVDRLVTASLMVIATVAVAATLLTPVLIPLTSHMAPAATRLGILFGFLCMPQIFFYGLYAVLGNVLNARDQFAAFMWSPALANLVQVAGMAVFLVLWGFQPSPEGWTQPMIWTLAGTFTLGIVVQGLFLVIPLVRGGFRYRPRFGLRGQGMGSASKMLGWTLTALAIQQLGGIVVQYVLTAVARRDPDAHAGGFMAYTNAMTIFFLPHGLITVSILTAIYPRMTRVWHDQDVKGMRGLVRQALCSPAVAVIPASAAMVVMARPLVDTMVHLPDGPARQVAEALQIMSLGILGFGVSTLQQRYSFARQEGRQNLWYQVGLTGIQVLFASLAMFAVPPRWALPVVALGLVVGNWTVSLVFMAVSRRQLGGLGLDKVARLWIRLLIASVPAAATAWLAVHGMTMFPRTWLVSALTCAVAGLCFGLVFLAISRILHLREVDDLLAPVLRRLHLAR